jgi:replicative DNA helicase
MDETEIIAENVFPMWQAASLAADTARDLASPLALRIKTGLVGVDDILNPQLGGSVISVLGRPQNAKSFLSDCILANVVQEIIEQGKQYEQAVIINAAEVSVEVTALKWMAKFSKIPMRKILRGECDPEDLQKLDNSLYQIMGYPIFVIGHSSRRSKENKRVRPEMSPDSINRSLEYIFNTYRNPETDATIDPKLIVTDYLQLLHVPRGMDRRAFSIEAMRWSKDVALWGGCPHIFNIQAGRQVDDRKIPIPQLGDGQETAAIEQFSDVVMSVFMPKVYNMDTVPGINTWGLPEVKVTNDMVYVTLLKQKDGEANKAWIFKALFDEMKLVPYA